MDGDLHTHDEAPVVRPDIVQLPHHVDRARHEHSAVDQRVRVHRAIGGSARVQALPGAAENRADRRVLLAWQQQTHAHQSQAGVNKQL